MRFYTTLLTLVFFLVLRLPGIREKVDFSASWRGTGSPSVAGGLTAFVAGVLTLTVPIWAGPSHMMGNAAGGGRLAADTGGLEPAFADGGRDDVAAGGGDIPPSGRDGMADRFLPGEIDTFRRD